MVVERHLSRKVISVYSFAYESDVSNLLFWGLNGFAIWSDNLQEVKGNFNVCRYSLGFYIDLQRLYKKCSKI